ncbi:protein toll [Caerostris extrusa]|uniref:Protein toll n=1 Tax=Caerostris extrusa TaxID=172846 RepID=A0AAV4PUI0_CAEEX|nr:protein toll [Caerostris extrusa]
MSTSPSVDRMQKESAMFAEKALWSLTDIDLCPENIGLYVTRGVLVPCFLLMVAGGKIAWTRYQMHVKVWLYSHGVTWVKEKDIDKDKEFDAFISFSHQDQDLVIPELIEQIEARDPRVKLFIHYKHFMPGELIQLNILRAIHVSKRTVLVLSKSFLESEWCMFEFRVAHIEGLKNHLIRIIIIKMGDLPKDEDLPEEIQVYLQSTTYLTWGTSTSGTPYSTPFPDLSTFPNHLIQNKSYKFRTSKLAPSGIQKCRDLVPECRCNDSQLAVELHCWNVSDFEKFNENLYKMNTLYILNIYEDSFLPRGFLRGLSVFKIIVFGPDLKGLEEEVFEGVVRLDFFSWPGAPQRTFLTSGLSGIR